MSFPQFDSSLVFIIEDSELDVVRHCIHIFITNVFCVSPSHQSAVHSASASTLDESRGEKNGHVFTCRSNMFVFKYTLHVCVQVFSCLVAMNSS